MNFVQPIRDKEKLEEYRRKQAKGYNYLLEDIKNYNKE